MNREEFINSINSWWDLTDFCNREGYEDYIDDIYNEDGRDDYIDSDLRYMVDDLGSWQAVLDALNDIPTGYEYYKRDGYEWYGLDNEDFTERREEVLDALDEDGFFDAGEEDPVEEYVDPEDLTPTEDEDICVTELLMVCSSTLQNIGPCKSNESDNTDDLLFSKIGISVNT